MRIGIDFDNTIANYEKVFRAAAFDMGLVAADFAGGKAEVRDRVRRLPDGEAAWQRLQGQVYGKLMGKAELVAGAGRFLVQCRDRGDMVFIVSHKTEFGHQDPAQVNLRDAAVTWMAAHRFFDAGGFEIPRANVHFESTRADKIARIGALDCTCYIDDLAEVLLDNGFPRSVRRILLGRAAAQIQLESYPSWDSIREALFDA